MSCGGCEGSWLGRGNRIDGGLTAKLRSLFGEGDSGRLKLKRYRDLLLNQFLALEVSCPYDMSADPTNITTMNVSLPGELVRSVREKVESGLYASASEVIREALRSFIGQGNGTRAELKTLAGDPIDLDQAQAAIEGFRKLRRGQRLDGMLIEDLINEGRKQ